jgi:hypothetical protein
VAFSWKDVGGFLANSAPLIGAALPIPGGAAIGGLIAAALGTGNDPDQVMAHLQANPDAIVKVKQIEADHERDLRSIAMQGEANRLAAETARIQADSADRASARAREVAVHDWTPSVLAWLVIGSNVALIGGIALGYVHPTDTMVAGLVGTSLGYLVSESKAVLAYYFGSSTGSKDKDVTLAEIAKGQQ